VNSVKSILVVIAMLLAANLASLWLRPAPQPLLELATPAHAGSVVAQSGGFASNYVTASQDGATLFLWSNNNGGYSAQVFQVGGPSGSGAGASAGRIPGAQGNAPAALTPVAVRGDAPIPIVND